MKTIAAAERRKFGSDILAARKKSHAADMLQFALLDEYAERACPLRPGDILAVTNLGRRSFFRVQRLDAFQTHGMRVPEWSVRVRSCIQDGNLRPGWRIIRQRDFTPAMLFKKASQQ